MVSPGWGSVSVPPEEIRIRTDSDALEETPGQTQDSLQDPHEEREEEVQMDI